MYSKIVKSMMVNLLMYHAGMPDAKPENQRARRNLGGISNSIHKTCLVHESFPSLKKWTETLLFSLILVTHSENN